MRPRFICAPASANWWGGGSSTVRSHKALIFARCQAACRPPPARRPSRSWAFYACMARCRGIHNGSQAGHRDGMRGPQHHHALPCRKCVSSPRGCGSVRRRCQRAKWMKAWLKPASCIRRLRSCGRGTDGQRCSGMASLDESLQLLRQRPSADLVG